MTGRHHLVLTGGLDALEALSEWVQSQAAELALPPRTAFHLELVLVEAATNIIEHAGAPDHAVAIELDCDYRNGQIGLELRDTGRPFDPTAYVFVPATDLAHAEPGGIGIHLIRQYVSSMQYRRDDNQNVLALTLTIEEAVPNL
jgi:anti-sigma regulatory factor (Ser/Thr protein kinase)